MDLLHRDLTEKLIAIAIEVHSQLGPGLLESTYEQCFCHELAMQKLPFENQVMLPIEYKGLSLAPGYRIDLVVDRKVIIEFKCVENLLPVHEAQLMTYLKLSKVPVGLLMNFHVPRIKDGIRRFVM